jgi:hypothetical protein
LANAEVEYLLGGLTSANLRWLGGGFQSGYSIYVTNQRILGCPSLRGAVGMLGIPGIVAVDRARADLSARTIQELDAKKKVEIRKEDIASIELKPAVDTGWHRQTGLMYIYLNSGKKHTIWIIKKIEYDYIRNLMAEFDAERLHEPPITQ